ncbi:MAG: AMP-binding protein, partial [Proteobacteria bacterium]|nr:AMP-binding protein [Pseudomonadota bacterium]
MAQRTDTDPKDLVRFRDILPGLARMILHAPSVIKHIKAATDIQDEDRKSLGWKLEENARLYPDRPAVLCEDVRMTHRELNEAVNRHAHYFLSLGLKKGDPVVVMIENRPEFLVVTGALAKIGAIASLINTNQRDQVLAYSINLTKGRIFVVGEELYDAFETVRPELGLTPESLLCFAPDRNDMPVPEGYVDLPAAIRNMPSEDPPTTGEVMIQDPICYIFTSGTTGLPKAAYLANRRWIGALYGFGKLLM